jgi:hypothetical protein
MLVIISDTHLTDGSSGRTTRAGAFRVFAHRLRDLGNGEGAWPTQVEKVAAAPSSQLYVRQDRHLAFAGRGRSTCALLNRNLRPT